tara:strand:+ start:330 stop:884 length:555 start_codon:yes stop_codon:yes gene_type:complete
MKKIYSDYFQKSKVFLYPLLNIKKGVRFVPSQTYLSWNGTYDIAKNKFICLYKIDPECKDFGSFAKEHLITSYFYDEYFKIDDENHIYIYDFNFFKDDLNKFKKGQYSKLSNEIKKQIIHFFGDTGTIAEYVDSYLYPEDYYEIYSKILNIPIENLIEVGELCDKPDFKKENLEKQSELIKLFK